MKIPSRKSLEISFRRWIEGKSPSKKLIKYLDIKENNEYIKKLGNKELGNIDHIIPLSLFNLSDPAHIRLAWSLDNIRRIKKKYNKNKGASIESAYITLIEMPYRDEKVYNELLSIVKTQF